MKSIVTVLFLIGFLPLSSYSQSVEISTSEIEYEDYQVASLMVQVDPDRATLQDAFEDWMKDNYDVKMRREGLFGNKEIRQAEAVNIPAITSDQINLYTKTVEGDEYTTMNLFVSRGLSNFLAYSDRTAFNAMEDILSNFLADYLPVYYQEQVEEAKEALSDLQDELEDAQEEYADNEEEIAELQRENQSLNEQIGNLKKDIQNNEQRVQLRLQEQQRISEELSSNQ